MQSSTSPVAVAPLFEPIQLGSLTLRNRVFMAALTRNRSVPTNVPNDVNLEYYKQRAKSAGLIISEGVLINRQGTEWPHAPGIWSQEQIAGWKKVTDAVHKEGSVIFAQLWHVGRVAHPDAPEQKATGQPVYAPSAVAAQGGKFRFIDGEPGYVKPTAVEDPIVLVDLFEQAAINAKEAGFDGVEVHGANGYLVHQFLDSTSNTRTDSWGGSVVNRSRFGLLVLQRLIKVFGKDRVGIKLSPGGGYNDMGMSLEETVETFSYFITEADKLRIAYIDVVRYMEAFDPAKRGTSHDVVATYGPLIKNARFFPNGGFSGEEAAALVKAGKASGVFFGFPWVTHPDVAKRLQFGKPLDNQVDFATLYGKYYAPEEEQKKGYTDYPEAQY
ncbi:flavoprotein NADH-dependent oxidoreductase [Rhodocollybia butyracea]|uniref:Flavoprotein NADH-dependent oxidoreductase n=1 Tax=Rhodocollybia butyracea TaxID=206335 RepID=A0A9P5UCK8_9AGAR|nr:flavoprotein NADH-dependent oxidoreductase [Rhodocollybia butyracea]